jgi:hypothetical protein
MGTPNRASRALIAGAVALISAQFWHTLRDRNRWPLCSYNLFNYYIPDRYPQVRVRLVTDRGSVVGPTDPWGVLPLEFFRVVSVIERVFLVCEDREVKDRFCRRVLRRLDASPWSGWDEIKGSYRPPPGERFVAMDLYLVEVDFDRCDPRDRQHVVSAVLLHRHDPQRVVDTEPEWVFVESDHPQDPVIAAIASRADGSKALVAGV